MSKKSQWNDKMRDKKAGTIQEKHLNVNEHVFV